jgi:RNA polymerase sigma-70 factor, ECF subfamily
VTQYSDSNDERLALEAEWVRLILRGDPEALEKLYNSSFDRVYSYFWRRVKNRAEAEALTSEVFMRALKALMEGQYTWQGKPIINWLYGLASHILLERWRELEKQPDISLDDFAGFELLIDTREDVLDALIRQEKQNKLWELVHDELSPSEQRIIVLRHRYDLSYAEIAQRYPERSEAAWKQFHHRTLKKLKNKIEETEVLKEVLKD